MPSSITHQLVAEEAIALLPARAQEAIRNAPDEYALGAQGPDWLFFYRIGSKKEYNFGKFLHRYRVYDVFCLFFRLLLQEDNDGRVPRLSARQWDEALAYILGYITHYAADSTFHPFVYRYMEEYGCQKFDHQQMENDWDVYFARALRGREAEHFDFAFSQKKITEHRTVQRIFNYLARELEREPVPPGKFRRGLGNFVLYLNFFHGACYRHQAFWEGFERLFHAKKMLSALYPRKSPNPAYLGGEGFWELSGGRGEQADALFCLAVDESVRLGALFLDALQGGGLLREDFGKGLLTGEIL